MAVAAVQSVAEEEMSVVRCTAKEVISTLEEDQGREKDARAEPTPQMVLRKDETQPDPDLGDGTASERR